MAGTKKSKYAGVEVAISAKVWLKGKCISLGHWPTERAAAIAYDRAVLHFRIDRPLNFPKESRRLGPASPIQLRKELRAGNTRGTKYLGVIRRDHRFAARVKVGLRQVSGGSWSTERRAALARDRIVLYYRLATPLNFPKEARRLGPASDTKMQELAARGD